MQGEKVKGRNSRNCLSDRYLPTSIQCDKGDGRKKCIRCEEKGIVCAVAPKKVRYHSSDSRPSSSRSVSAGVPCNEDMSSPLYPPYAKF